MRLDLRHLPADIFGLSSTARTALADRPHPRGLPGMVIPDTTAAVPRLDSSFSSDMREELRRCIETGLAPFAPHIHVLESVRKLSHPDAALVVAGQQPGFLGGPLYNIYKALSALRLARELSTLWDVPVLPLFWNHADDHDIAEVHHLWVQNEALDLRKIALFGTSSGRTPLSDLKLEEDAHRLLSTSELLRSLLPDLDHRERALSIFLPRAGETFSGAFTRALLELFGEHGLIVLEPDWIRAPLSRSLAHIVASDVGHSLRAGSAALAAVGGSPAIDPEAAALVFRKVDGKRQALRLTGDELRYDNEAGSRTGTELAAEIVQAPDEWSAGALLRPLAQDRTLPVVAYVGGWGELGYHAQLPALRERAGIRRTAFVPRLSATLLDPALTRSLHKLGVEPRAALESRGALPAPEEADQPASALGGRLRAVGDDAKLALLALRKDVAEIDGGLAGQLKRVASQVAGAIEKLGAKVDRVQDNAAGTARRHRRRIQNGLYPREQPQERVQGALEVVARHGTDWIDLLLEEIDVLPTEHLLVSIIEGDEA